MSSYNVEACDFKYRVSSLEKVVDGDTIDVNIDLGLMYARNSVFAF